MTTDKGQKKRANYARNKRLSPITPKISKELPLKSGCPNAEVRRKTALDYQLLIDSLSRQSLSQLLLDNLMIRLAGTSGGVNLLGNYGRIALRPGRRFGLF